MNYVWVFMLAFSFFTAAVNGEMQSLSNAILNAVTNAITLCIKLAGAMCLWGGLMNVARESGLTSAICRLLSPFLRLVFPSMDMRSPSAKAIAMNVTANLLGLGNAATPFGIEAMRCLKESSPGNVASDDMIRFVVLNSAAFHLLPTTIAMLRLQAGSTSPLDIMPASWISSAATLTVGLSAAWIMIKAEKYGGELYAKHKRVDIAGSSAGHSPLGLRKKG